MKSTATLLMIMALSCIGLRAQQPIVVSEDSLDFGQSSMPSLSVTIPEANYQDVMKSWKKELESVSKAKTIINDNEISLYGANLKNVSAQPVNVYSRIATLDSSLLLTVAFEENKDEYIEKTKNEMTLTKAKEYLREFARIQYVDVAKDQADVEEKKLSDLQKELSSLEKEKSRLQKSIASDSSSLFSENENIRIQKNVLETVSGEIIDQNKQMAAPSSDDVRKEKEKLLKDLEKRKNKALSSIESSQNKISKTNNEIERAVYEIPKNEQLQIEVKEKIAAQQKVYERYAEKIKTIESY
jgi:chromosome segregation ATPase